MNTAIRRFKQTALALSVTLMTAPAWAVPTLQLDIAGGTYDNSTESVLASSNTFSLYAYGLASGPKPVSLADDFFLSVSLLGVPQPGDNHGSFTVNGQTINATGDMIWGTPPVDSILGNAEWDPGDLRSHGIFPAYFKEIGFQFSAGNTSGEYNTQINTGSGPTVGTAMYYKRFDFDVSGLTPGLSVHFDLYNSKFSKGLELDVDKFAPFSHDAEAHVMTPIPEPETYAMLLAGLGLMGLVARRRKGRAG
jgi:hypothetical protein